MIPKRTSVIPAQAGIQRPASAGRMSLLTQPYARYSKFSTPAPTSRSLFFSRCRSQLDSRFRGNDTVREGRE